MNEKVIVFSIAISLMVFLQNPGYGDSAKTGANEMSVVVDCDKAAFFPLLRTKFGCAKTLSTRSLESFHDGLESIDEIVLHQLMGAPRPWYNEDPTLIRLKQGQKKPYFDDRFPVPTDVTAAADAMVQWVSVKFSC